MKPQRLLWQLYPSYLVLILLLLLAVTWYVTVEFGNFYHQQTQLDLRARATLVEQQLAARIAHAQDGQLDSLIQRLGETSATRITIIQADGRVIADSRENFRQMDNHRNRPEVEKALSGAEGVSIRFSGTLGQTLMYVALPAVVDGRIVGSVRVAIPMTAVEKTLASIYPRIAGGGLIIAALAAIGCLWLSRRLSRPLELMEQGAQRFARGELNSPLVVSGSEEVRRLGEAMNRMAADLAKRIEMVSDQRNEIEAVLSSMSDGVLAVDNAERVLRMNQAAMRLFSVSNRTVQGKPIQEVIRQADLQLFVRRALRTEDRTEEELIFRGRQEYYLHAVGSPLYSATRERIGMLIVLHDVTRLRRLESMRRDFVANVSHELKTPITAISGAVETLLDGGTEDNETAEKFLRITYKQAERLNTLVEDLLDLSRIEQGGSEGDWVLNDEPIAPVLESARQTCETLAEKADIEILLTCQDQLHACIHPPLLEQAVVNLLSNAIKYSNPAGKVVLDASSHDERVIIKVQDFGCGIEEEHQSRLFERFYRVDKARSRQLGGTGLGLAIVKHVVQAHRGDVTVISKPGCGSTFSISLPINSVPDA
ncbi:MAG TPA: ATP-binding protein [Geopsychrobacteraceae bacterium]|nr:ATP-binding protein [Geopsychrobacteraceae bacterium]